MKFRMKMMIGAAVLLAGSLVALAVDIPGDQNFTGDVNLDGVWAIKGTKVTATAANLNAGVASSTATLVSNATLKVYAGNIQNNGYQTAVAGTSGGTAVYSVQGANAAVGTNGSAVVVTFAPSFIAKPAVTISYETYTTNNAYSVASNTLTIVCGAVTNFNWIAVGRVK